MKTLYATVLMGLVMAAAGVGQAAEMEPDTCNSCGSVPALGHSLTVGEGDMEQAREKSAKGRSLVVVGGIMFGVTYGVPAAMGLGFADEPNCTDCFRCGMLMLIPFAGPVVSAVSMDNASEYTELIGMAAVLSTFQVIGLTLSISGRTMRYKSHTTTAALNKTNRRRALVFAAPYGDGSNLGIAVWGTWP